MDRIILTLDQKKNEVAKILQDLPKGNKDRGHKFVYTTKSELIISTTGEKKPDHGDLGDGYDKEDIGAAGWVKFMFDSKSQITEVNFINRSSIYCLSFASLQKAASFIVKILDSVKVNLKNDQNPNC